MSEQIEDIHKEEMEKAKVDPKLISLKSEIITKENEEEIVETVSELSIPRLVGTVNEKKAVQLIVDKFHKIGLKIKKYGFWATHYWTDIFIRRSLAVLLLLGIAVAISSTRNLDWTFAIMIIMAICGVFIFRNLTRQDLPIVGERYKSVNLRADVPSEMRGTEKKNEIDEEEVRRRLKIPKYKKKLLRFFDYYEEMLSIDELEDYGAIIIMAHHDSKSQPLKTYVRALFFTTTSLSIVVAVVCFIITSFMQRYAGVPAGENTARFIGYVATIVGVLATIPLVFNGVGNNSLGAMDNASGVAVVHQIAKYFKEHPLKHFRVICLINGSEEVSTLGSRYMSPIIQKEIGEKPVFVLNFDMVGLKNKPVQFIEGSMMTKEVPLLKQLAYDTAAEMFIPVDGFSFVVGAMTDGFIFSEAGFQSIDFVNRDAAFFTHTPQDTPDKFDGLAGLHYVALAAGMMTKIDRQIKLKKKRRKLPKLKKKTNAKKEEKKKSKKAAKEKPQDDKNQQDSLLSQDVPQEEIEGSVSDKL